MSRRDQDEPHIPTQAELNRAGANAAANNEHRLAQQFEIKDGKFMGLIPIPQELERTFGLLINPLIAGIAGGAGKFAYKGVSRLLATSALKGTVKDPDFIAKVAQTGVTGAVIAMDTITSAYSLTKERTANYLQIAHETREIAEETGASLDNRMLGLAYKKYHASWGSDIKKLIPSIVQLVSTLPHAIAKYNEIWPESPLFSNAFGHAPASTAPAANSERPSRSEIENAIYDQADAKGWSEYTMRGRLNSALREHGYTPDNTVSASHSHDPNQPMDIMDVMGKKWTVAVPAIAGFVAPDIRSWATKQDRKKHQELNSLEMVEALRERVANGSTNRVHEDVIAIFRQFEKDMGHKDFNSPKLAESTQAIAKAIIDGSLGVRGLVRLVGDDMVVSGAGNNRDIKSAEEIAKAIKLVSASTVSKDSEISEDRFMSRFERAALIEDTIRSNLADFKGTERDFFVSLMPLEILEHTGLSKKEIRECRIRAQEHIYENVAAAIIHLASHDEQYLKDHDISLKEIKYLQTLSQRIMAGDTKTLHELVDHKEQGLTHIVAAGLLAEQADRVHGDRNTWAERVKEGKNVQNRIDEIKAEHANKPHHPEPHAAKHQPHQGHTDHETTRRTQQPSGREQGA